MYEIVEVVEADAGPHILRKSGESPTREEAILIMRENRHLSEEVYG